MAHRDDAGQLAKRTRHRNIGYTMIATTARHAERPPLALRVGITGGRSILPEHELRVSEQVAGVLRLVRQEVSCLARMTEAKLAYRTDANGKIVPSFRFLSPLAEGADRLAARIAHAERWDLAVPMPFHREEYALDFKTKARKVSTNST